MNPEYIPGDQESMYSDPDFAVAGNVEEFLHTEDELAGWEGVFSDGVKTISEQERPHGRSNC